MRKRSFQLGLVVLAVLVGLGTAYLLRGQSHEEWPMFLVHDPANPSKALAVFVDPALLRKHDVSIDQFEKAFRDPASSLAVVLGIALAEAFGLPEEQEGVPQDGASREQKDIEFNSGLTAKAFLEIVEGSRFEEWECHADGTHTVKRAWSQNEQRSRTTSPKTESQWSVSTAPATLSEAKETFNQETGITWPESASDIRFDEKRLPLLGDGEFYIVFNVPPEVLRTWLRSDAPWGEKAWTQGPIPAEIGTNCAFGYQGLRSYRAREDGQNEYSNGDPEIIAVMTSKDVWYAARARGPSKQQPWYNGDLLILDPRTCVVRYCRWDM